jgi:tetratricopeptide (TPR) repeat protein/uncharacterized membrane protein YidH (DUF202 family)
MGLFPPSMPRARSSDPLRNAATASLVAAVAGTTLWLGGAPPGAAVLAVLLSATALGLLVASDQGRLVVPPLALLPLSVAGLCVLQLVPLPPALAGVLSPPLGELRAFALVPLGLDGWRPLSHDPPATATALVGSLSAAAALVVAAGLSRSRTRRRQLAAGIGLTGLTVALIGFGHALADASTLFGLHRFQNGLLPFLTPFGNPNHLAAFATLASALLLGLAADSHPHRPRQLLWVAAAVAVGAAAFLSLSRGGILFWCAGQLAFLLLVLRRRDARGTSGRAIPIALAVGTVALVAGYLALDRIGAELASVDTVEKLRSSKVDLWPMFSRPALAAWLTGLGRGTFAVAFPRWQSAHSSITFTFEYPENLPLQLGSELGIPATLGLLALAAWATVRTARAGSGAPIVLAAWAGVGALVLHDLFDFALELPACATAAAVALGIASGPWVEQHERALPRTQALVGLAAAALLALLGIVRGADSAARAETRLAAHATGNAASVRDEARALVDRHPADALLYRIAGWTEATRPGGQPRVALAWLNRALFLQPLDPDTHRVVARALFQLGAPDQALVEERLALESGAERAAVFADALPRARDVDALWNLVGETPSHVDLLVVELWKRGRTEDARGLLDRALLTFTGPEAAALTVTAARIRLQTGDAAGALVLLDSAEKEGQDVALPRAAALAALGRRREAIRILESAIARSPESAEIAFALAGYLVAEGRPALARAALERVQPFLAAGGARTRLVLAQAETYRVEGRYGRALDLVQTAMRLAPGDPGLHRQAAELYESLKRPREALHEVEVALSLSGQPADPGTQAWLERLRTAVDVETVRALDPARGLDALEPPDAGSDSPQPRRAQTR